MALHRFVRVRHRYLFTKNNKLRLRYFAGTFAIMSMTATGMFGATNASIAFAPAKMMVSEAEGNLDLAADADQVALREEALLAVQALNNAVELDETPVLDEIIAEEQHYEAALSAKPEMRALAEKPVLTPIPDELLSEVQEVEQTDLVVEDEESVLAAHQDNARNNDLLLEKVEFQPLEDVGEYIGEEEIAALEEPALPRDEILEIKSGDTLAGALQSVGVSGADAYKAVKAMSKHYSPRMLKPGQAIAISLEGGDEGLQLAAMKMKLSATEEMVVERDDSGRYSSDKVEKDVVLEMQAASASIQSSLYGSAARAGIPASIVAEMIRIYSYEVDFQRDIREGDQVKVLYETYETEDGDFARYGNILYASLMVDGKEIPVYRYDGNDGESGYYRENGKSLKRTLMSTPIDGARISSGFGMRHHPVLGYNKMHKGMDFAAPRGTPIYAAGDGVIEQAGRHGAYGNYIRIRHNGELKTAYAHMHKFANGMAQGKRVKQGDVIGYVGTTGRSTGPHLHFEVLRNGKQINPKSIKSSSGISLAGNSLEKFRAQVQKFNREYAALKGGHKVAQIETNTDTEKR